MRVEPERVTPPREVASAHLVPGVRTPLSAAEVQQALAIGYKNVTGQAPTPETLAVLCAQVATETAFGQHMVAYNFGGLKGTSPEGRETRCATHEIIAGSDQKIVDGFRAYTSAEAGATDYIGLLAHRFPRALDAAGEGDVQRFAVELKQGHYFTANAGAYASALRSAMTIDGTVGGNATSTPMVRPHQDANPLPSSADLSRVLDALSQSALSVSATSHATKDDEDA